MRLLNVVGSVKDFVSKSSQIDQILSPNRKFPIFTWASLKEQRRLTNFSWIIALRPGQKLSKWTHAISMRIHSSSPVSWVQQEAQTNNILDFWVIPSPGEDPVRTDRKLGNFCKNFYALNNIIAVVYFFGIDQFQHFFKSLKAFNHEWLLVPKCSMKQKLSSRRLRKCEY